MIIILAGPDGAGKSTYGEYFSNTVGLQFISGNTNKTEDKLKTANEQLKMDNVVFDRFFIPDHFVYSDVKGDKIPEEEMKEWNKVIEELQNRLCVIFYIDADNDVLKSRLEDRGDDYVTAEEIQTIKDSYKKILPELNIPVIPFKSHENFHVEYEGEALPWN